MSTTKFDAAVEAYLADLRRIKASGGATSERSYYSPLTNLMNAIGSTLRPKVFCVGELAEQGAGQTNETTSLFGAIVQVTQIMPLLSCFGKS